MKKNNSIKFSIRQAPWMAVEESINSFKSAWFEGENDDIEDEEEKVTICVEETFLY